MREEPETYQRMLHNLVFKGQQVCKQLTWPDKACPHHLFLMQGSYHYLKMVKGKVLDNLFSDVSKSKNCNNYWLSCHVNDPSLINGYCDRREVISNFHRVINKYRDCRMKD